MHQAVDTAEIDEGAEVDDGGHDTLADLALLQLVQELGADLGLGLLEPGTTGQDNVVALLVQLDDLGLDLLANVRLEIPDTTHLDEGGRQEAAQPDVEDEAALDDLDDGTGDRLVLLLELLDGAPGALVLGTLLGEDQATVLVLLGEDQSVDLIADLDDLARVDVVLDGQLTGGDNTLRLVADVQEDLVVIDLDDGTLDDVTVVEVLDGRIDGGEEILSGADVVDGNLRNVVGGHR
ncbi:polyribonucleotide nucleotidyltransferase [Corynebacterium terpenotabidum Y-11]|uniref:Polyribonucleotide nucleotidyltransferase n=1 Tax=Corynebacterium terpenotabidum Y-11 TaxID=1200352 RepID=S4XG63_9CORY|nr:polyribonucleotide nucleotidyltransferase [Corynebacterium terpenotabidum Y-11]